MLKKVFRAHLCYFSLLKATTDSGLFIKSVPSGPKLLCREPVQVLCVCSCCQWSALCQCCVGVVSALCQCCFSIVSVLLAWQHSELGVLQLQGISGRVKVLVSLG